MKRKHTVRTILCVSLAATVLTALTALAAGDPGGKADPLVTLSYLTETFAPRLMDEVDGLLEKRNAALAKELLDKQFPDGSGEAYATVTLSAGEILRGETGCEVLLRFGSARCAGTEAVGLVDTTSGGSLNSGNTLEANHLYLLPEVRDVASPDGAVLLVRGSYTIV